MFRSLLFAVAWTSACSSATPSSNPASVTPDAGDTDASSDASAEASAPIAFTDTVAMFHLNVQDHGRVESSAATVKRVLDLHEALDARLDVYLTTWMIDDFERAHPELLQRLFTSPLVSLSYHTRPPVPYRAQFLDNNKHDWLGLWNMTAQEQYDAVKKYESFGLDLATGRSTTAEGGFVKLTRLYGRPPYVAGDESNGQQLQTAVDKVFGDLGVTFVVSHERQSSGGDTRNGVMIKPEWIDVKLFSTDTALDMDACLAVANDGAAVYDCEMLRCAGQKAPCVAAFKMHDNNFFETESWWEHVYGHHPTPPWNADQQAPLSAQADQDFQWTRYEAAVRRAVARRADYGIVGAKDWAKRLGK